MTEPITIDRGLAGQGPRSKSSLVVQRGLTAGYALSLQGVSFVATLGGGIILARQLEPSDRGVLAIATLATSVGSLLAAAGLPEANMAMGKLSRLGGRWASRHAFTALAGSVSAFGICLLMGVHLSLLQSIFLAGNIASSSINVVLVSNIQLTQGLGKVLALRAIYSIATFAGLGLLFLAAIASTLAVLIMWMTVEILLCCICLIIRQSSPTLSVSTDTRIWRPGYVLAQLGALFIDRGLLVVAGLTGDLRLVAYLTVASSASAPIGIPIQAVGTQILDRAPEHVRARTAALWAGYGSVLTIGLALMIALPLAAVRIFGSEYTFIQDYGILIGLQAGIGGCWRITHLQLRSRGRPALAAATDVIAIAIVALFGFFVLQKESLASAPLMLLTFAIAGLSVSSIFLAISHGRLIQVRGEDQSP